MRSPPLRSLPQPTKRPRLDKEEHPSTALSSSSFFELYYDLTEVIFSFLSPQELCRLACVSKSCKQLAEVPLFWEQLVRSAKTFRLLPRASFDLGNQIGDGIYRDSRTGSDLADCYLKAKTSDAVVIPHGVYGGSV